MTSIGERRIRVAMIGAGMISQFQLKAWKKLANVDVVAVVDPVLEKARARAVEFGVPNYYSSLDELLNDRPVDAVDIASPRETHGAMLVAAASRGIGVLCQKPFMPTLREAEEILESVGSGARIMVNQNFRFRPYYQKIRQWIAEGMIGELTGLSIQCRSAGLIADATGKYPAVERQPFIQHEKRYMIEEVLIHRLDVARWLWGNDVAFVAATTARTCPVLLGESEATLLLRDARNGSPIVVDGNLTSVGYPSLSQDRVEVIGRLGRITLDHHVLVIEGLHNEQLQYRHDEIYQQSFDNTIRHFVDGLVQGHEFLTSPEDNLLTLRLVESAYAFADRAIQQQRG